MPRPVICVADANVELIEIFCMYLEAQGDYKVVPLIVSEVQYGKINFAQFLKDNQPDLFIWDLPYPYLESWNFLQLVKSSRLAEGIQFISICTNPVALQKILPEDEFKKVQPLLSKPFNMLDIMAVATTLLGGKIVREKDANGRDLYKVIHK